MSGWMWMIVGIVGLIAFVIVAEMVRQGAQGAREARADSRSAMYEHELALANIESENYRVSLSGKAQSTIFQHRPPTPPDLLGRSIVHGAGDKSWRVGEGAMYQSETCTTTTHSDDPKVTATDCTFGGAAGDAPEPADEQAATETEADSRSERP